jgi:hypothetical protein
MERQESSNIDRENIDSTTKRKSVSHGRVYSTTKPKIISGNVPSSPLPPPTLQHNSFKFPSRPLPFGTFPDWIKTHKIGRFLLVLLLWVLKTITGTEKHFPHVKLCALRVRVRIT